MRLEIRFFSIMNYGIKNLAICSDTNVYPNINRTVKRKSVDCNAEYQRNTQKTGKESVTVKHAIL